jgi:hypothetical protein
MSGCVKKLSQSATECRMSQAPEEEQLPNSVVIRFAYILLVYIHKMKPFLLNRRTEPADRSIFLRGDLHLRKSG